jgi:hypothetical protein
MSPTSSPSPHLGHAAAAGTPIATTGKPAHIPIFAWSIGPAATRSIIIRISLACGGPPANRHAGRSRAGLDGNGAVCVRAALHRDLGQGGYRGQPSDPLLVAMHP